MKRKPKLGQNFLADDRARHAIVEALGDIRQRTVIEIGPGRGAITDILAEKVGHLIALELDRELAPALARRFAEKPNVRVIEIDVLKANFASIVPTGETADVVGNLPYYITSDILLSLFHAGASGLLSRAVVMMQREVAERVAASPGGREYGLLSATAQINARVEHLFTLPPSAFSPPPEVYSTVLRLDFAPRFSELGVDPDGFDSFLKQIFAQKRKTIENNLRAAGYASDDLESHWPAAVPRKVRAETLPLEAMAELYHALKQ
jgi:16S rRNA (adenine1518-N6/adenine1519-N6)-dimethyltransferase